MMDDPTYTKEVVKSARKWLIVSFCGLAIFLGALGFHFFNGASSHSDPLPNKVLNQVFGFTPYYFVKNTPPDHLRLDLSSPKFLGNIFSIKLINTKNESITVNQQTLPDKFTNSQQTSDEPVNSSQGSGTISSVDNGHLKATFVTNDKTLITIDTTDLLNPSTVKDILQSLRPIDKATGTPALPQ